MLKEDMTVLRHRLAEHQLRNPTQKLIVHPKAWVDEAQISDTKCVVEEARAPYSCHNVVCLLTIFNAVVGLVALIFVT